MGGGYDQLFPPEFTRKLAPSNSKKNLGKLLQKILNNSHYFHIMGDKLINPIVGGYIYPL